MSLETPVLVEPELPWCVLSLDRVPGTLSDGDLLWILTASKNGRDRAMEAVATWRLMHRPHLQARSDRYTPTPLTHASTEIRMEAATSPDEMLTALLVAEEK